jgi:hypothetical protein
MPQQSLVGTQELPGGLLQIGIQARKFLASVKRRGAKPDDRQWLTFAQPKSFTLASQKFVKKSLLAFAPYRRKLVFRTGVCNTPLQNCWIPDRLRWQGH